jgi:serine/threonine-protein kinase HipA
VLSVRDHFDNLLPDSEQIRRRIATRYRADGTSAFQLLAKLGRDCVGAVIDEVTALLPREFPMDVADAIFAGMRRQSHKLAAA